MIPFTENSRSTKRAAGRWSCDSGLGMSWGLHVTPDCVYVRPVPARRKERAANPSRSSWQEQADPHGVFPRPPYPAPQPPARRASQERAPSQDQALVRLLSSSHTPQLPSLTPSRREDRHAQTHRGPSQKRTGPAAAPRPSGVARNMGHGAAGAARAGRAQAHVPGALHTDIKTNLSGLQFP